MDKPFDASLEITPAPPAADMSYRDDTVARVLVRVEYADGRIREYEAREPQDFQFNNPEDVSSSSVAIRPSGLSLPAGGDFRTLWHGVPALRLSFIAHPRWNLHIRTERTAEPARREADTGPVVLQGEVSDEQPGAAPIPVEHAPQPPALPA